ncbi:MAG: carbohydrate ABC transporter permease [Candidatus Bipolaricaulia bacterium]
MKRLGRHLLLTGIVALVSLPFLWMVLASLKDGAEIFREPERWLSSGWKLSNYHRVWQDLPLARLYLNSLIVAVTVTLGQLLSGSLAGYAFARLHFPGRDMIFYIYLGSLMVPHQVTLIPSFLILRWLGLLNTYGALICPFLAGPFAAFVMRQAFLEVPQILEEAARIDGCSRFQALWKVLLPVVRPSLVALGILIFLWQWNSLLWPLVVTQSPGMRTLPVGLASLKSELGTDWPLLLAANTLAALPALILFFFGQRALIRGLTPPEAG